MASNHNFSHSTIHDINRWVHSFDFSTKINFIAFKLKGIKALKSVKIKWDFLRVVVKFWDPEDHVFRFNTTELCSTIEEFSAILGYDPSKKYVAVSCEPGIRNLCLILSVFLLPLLIVWLRVIWWIFVALSLGWLTNAPMEWLTTCRKTSVWLYALWENFCFALEDTTL